MLKRRTWISVLILAIAAVITTSVVLGAAQDNIKGQIMESSQVLLETFIFPSRELSGKETQRLKEILMTDTWIKEPDSHVPNLSQVFFKFDETLLMGISQINDTTSYIRIESGKNKSYYYAPIGVYDKIIDEFAPEFNDMI